MSAAVYDWEQERFVAVESDVPELGTGTQLPDPITLTADTDPTWDAPCPVHRAWMWNRRHAMPPVRPPQSSCPYCQDAALLTPEATVSQSEWEIDRAKHLNRAAPPAARDHWARKESHRRTAERAMLDRRAELAELESVIHSEPNLGTGYVPSPVRDGGEYQNLVQPSPAARKKHADRVKAAKARRDRLLREPLDLPSEVQYEGRDLWEVQG